MFILTMSIVKDCMSTPVGIDEQMLTASSKLEKLLTLMARSPDNSALAQKLEKKVIQIRKCPLSLCVALLLSHNSLQGPPPSTERVPHRPPRAC